MSSGGCSPMKSTSRGWWGTGCFSEGPASAGRPVKTGPHTSERVEDVLERIDWNVVQAHFVMQIRPGGTTRRANGADDVAALHVISGLHSVAGEMGIACRV